MNLRREHMTPTCRGALAALRSGVGCGHRIANCLCDPPSVIA